MSRDDRLSRRRVLEVTGAAASTAFIAGCGGGNGGNGGENSSDGGGGGGGATEIEPGTEIELRSLSTSWEGMSPDGISGTENPAISLVQGETYTITWAENDQGTHNLALYNSDESVVEDYSTEQTEDPGDGLSLEFEASEDIAEYVCEPHYSAGMAGSIELREGSGGSGNESSGNESGGNESSE